MCVRPVSGITETLGGGGHRRPRAASTGAVGAPPRGLLEIRSGESPEPGGGGPRLGVQGSRKAQDGEDPAPLQTPGSPSVAS